MRVQMVPKIETPPRPLSQNLSSRLSADLLHSLLNNEPVAGTWCRTNAMRILSFASAARFASFGFIRRLEFPSA